MNSVAKPFFGPDVLADRREKSSHCLKVHEFIDIACHPDTLKYSNYENILSVVKTHEN